MIKEARANSTGNRSPLICVSTKRRWRLYRKKKWHHASIAPSIPHNVPATTSGSFPQTKEVRAGGRNTKPEKGDEASCESFLRGEIRSAVQFQEEVGLDVLVHGEFERNDMVEYFGEQLAGFAVTKNGWVQSCSGMLPFAKLWPVFGQRQITNLASPEHIAYRYPSAEIR